MNYQQFIVSLREEFKDHPRREEIIQEYQDIVFDYVSNGKTLIEAIEMFNRQRMETTRRLEEFSTTTIALKKENERRRREVSTKKKGFFKRFFHGN